MYTIFKVKDKEYKLRINTKGMIELEKRLGKNPISLFTTINEQNLPKLGDMLIILHVSLQALNHGISIDDVYEIYDEYVDDGNTFMDLIPVIIDVFKVSGLFAEEKKGKSEKN